MVKDGSCSYQNREEIITSGDREVLLKDDTRLPHEQEDLGGSRDHPVEKTTEQDRWILHTLDETYPKGSSPRDLAQAARGGARTENGLCPRRVGD